MTLFSPLGRGVRGWLSFTYADFPLLIHNRYDLKQMLMKSAISRVPDELRKHEAAQQKSQKGGGQKKIEESSGFAGKGGW